MSNDSFLLSDASRCQGMMSGGFTVQVVLEDDGESGGGTRRYGAAQQQQQRSSGFLAFMGACLAASSLCAPSLFVCRVDQGA